MTIRRGIRNVGGVILDVSQVGSRRKIVREWRMDMPPDPGGDGDRMTLRDFISRVVYEEVEAFGKRQRARQLFRVLSEREMRDGGKRGEVKSGGDTGECQSVETEDAVSVALQAFQDGLYLVILDGVEKRRLDEEVEVRPDSEVTFLRLTMLAGA